MLVQSDFFDPIYAIQAAPLGFGAAARPTAIAVAGRNASAAVLEYGADRCAVLTFPPRACESPETTEIVGSEGRITLQRPAHCPTRFSVRVPEAGGVPSLYQTANVPPPEQVFEYPLPGAVSLATSYPNQHGFLYQAEAIHRCLAAGLRECPQYGREESLHAMDLLTGIANANRAAERT